MSKTINTRANFRWQLLATVSAFALLGSAYGASKAQAEDTDRPQIWIELGGQLSRLQDGQEAFAPVFPNSPARPAMFSPSQPFERPPLYSIDEQGKISFQPDGSDWIFSASVRYGRSASKRDVHQQTYPQSFVTRFTYSGVYHQTLHFPAYAARLADTSAQTSERHSVLDFQAGKDVGLGMFGATDGSSVLNVGVRFAQFSSKSNINLKSDPDWHRQYKYFSYPTGGIYHLKLVSAQPYHSNAASLTARRSFRGVGPSISWNGSAPFAGNAKDGEITFDWGMNAALLFGRQRTKTHHQTTGRYGAGTNYNHAVRPITYQAPVTPDHTRSRSVMVPNAGGFAGLTFRIEDFKVSAGYRADFFFNAIDGGIDARKNENRAFFGPFANISVGLGD